MLASHDLKSSGQYRDQESTLDWFEVRHMSGAQGRFQSVDPGNAGADLSDPQTWNAYAYVGNNPLSYTDPSGEFGVGTEVGSAFGPIGTAIGIGVDIGLALWDIFGGGGHTPSLGNFPFPNQVPTSGPTGGSSDTDGGFGSGNTDPFVFSILQANGNAANVASYNAALQYLMRDAGMALIIRRLQASKTVYGVTMRKGVQGVGGFNRGANEILWDPHASATITGGRVSPAFVLGHELAHAEGWDSGKISFVFRELWPSGAYGNREEERVITGPETAAARTLGEPTRQNHIASPAHSPNSTSRACQ